MGVEWSSKLYFPFRPMLRMLKLYRNGGQVALVTQDARFILSWARPIQEIQAFINSNLLF